jgi:hypothetical protein
MSQRNRISTAIFVGVTAAVLTLVLPVEAQVPSTAPAVNPADGNDSRRDRQPDTVHLTMEQRHIIKEIIIKDMKITEPQDQAAKVPTQVGDIVPTGIPLQPMPVEVSAKIPQLKTHSFLVKNDTIVIIDPKDNKVAALVE